MKKMIFGLACLMVFLALTQPAQAWEERLRYLRALDVEKNVDRLLRTRECRGCYLKGANLRGYDLSDVQIERAELDNAIWTNGEICQKGSIGRCKTGQQEN